MKKKSRVLAVVAARGGSKGIKNKNLRKINGIPLLLHSIKSLSKSGCIDLICVSTDSQRIKYIVKKSYPKVYIDNRPKKYSKDKVPLTSVPHYVCKKFNKEGNFYDYVLQVAPTCPFIKISTIQKIVKMLKKKESDCVVTIKRIEHEHPYRAKKFNKKNNSITHFLRNINVEKFISRQDLPSLYCTSGAIYGRSNKLISSFNGKDFCLGKKPKGVIVDDIEAVNIDRKIDLDFAKYLSLKQKN